MSAFPPRPLVVARPCASEGPDPRTTRAGGRFDERVVAAGPRTRRLRPSSPRAPCAGAFRVSGPRPVVARQTRGGPAHAHGGEGRGDRGDHRAVPELQRGGAHRVPRADRGAADPAASFPRCGQQLRRRQEHPDEAGGGPGGSHRPGLAAQRPHRDRLHPG
nr:50S ribosomal protein L10 [uncultured bacterium]